MVIRTILVAVRPGAPQPDLAALGAVSGPGPGAQARLVAFDLPDGGVPAVEIARSAEREDADLIVLPREPHDIVDGTVRRARVPCLIVPPGQTAFGRVLAAVDASPDSREITEAALAIGRLVGGAVTALHVEQPALVAAGRGSDRPAWAAPAVACRVMVRQGDPVAEILRTVREDGFDLLVHGHHRGGPRWGHETGSIAARLLRRAPCAVLTVPI
ncbi:MAG TPA: universal stress protein [Gemmatimonadales bacterium]|nr:universal stress protein [Gemmatimonadales bacterium]